MLLETSEEKSFVMLMQRFQRHDRDDIDQPFSSMIKKDSVDQKQASTTGAMGVAGPCTSFPYELHHNTFAWEVTTRVLLLRTGPGFDLAQYAQNPLPFY